MKKSKIILIHFVLFILLSLVFFFSAESILKTFAPDLNYVTVWITLVNFGIAFIFIVLLISCLIFILRKKKTKKIEKIELTKNGFQINYDEEITQFKWSEIEKLTGFKVDRITTDDICLKIESDNKISFATEEFEGWRIFMTELLNKFPEIDKNWESIIAISAFERKETELYNRNKNVG
ncbi:Asp23/Gls24 family envelope stress response protein [Aestuariibaculum marinum]|uniref:Uncharacterized protein n=1 Tax=Aestuariibaculum marinum TaxID=2683592 RepID=A0A8J6PXQ3_9FLAO|nr:hypothetical protein [Aestuariibaculum marinum]MBD0825470.1 hypothetical protein [Aestuariibaculum marinum]